MVSSCWAPNCTNRFRPGSPIKFFRFPHSKPERLTKWLRAINRTPGWQQTTKRPDGFLEPTRSSRLCSIHFISGCPTLDPDDIDYVPSIFQRFKETKRDHEMLKRKEEMQYGYREIRMKPVETVQIQTCESVQLNKSSESEAAPSSPKILKLDIEKGLLSSCSLPRTHESDSDTDSVCNDLKVHFQMDNVDRLDLDKDNDDNNSCKDTLKEFILSKNQSNNCNKLVPEPNAYYHRNEVDRLPYVETQRRFDDISKSNDTLNLKTEFISKDKRKNNFFEVKRTLMVHCPTQTDRIERGNKETQTENDNGALKVEFVQEDLINEHIRLHQQIRDLERDVRKVKKEIKDIDAKRKAIEYLKDPNK